MSTIILNYVWPIITIIITIFSIILAIIKNKGLGNYSSLITILELIPQLVIDAERKYGKGKGAEKLEDVLLKLQLITLQNKIKIDDKFLIDNVNRIVNATKNVNCEKITPVPRPTPSEIEQAGLGNEIMPVNNKDNLNI